LQDKEALIVELRNAIAQMKAANGKVAEEETQCSFEEDSTLEQEELVRRLSEVLSAREEEGVSLHLATREKDEIIHHLQQTLQGRDAEVQ
jgi:hypothetical protein